MLFSPQAHFDDFCIDHTLFSNFTVLFWFNHEKQIIATFSYSPSFVISSKCFWIDPT